MPDPLSAPSTYLPTAAPPLQTGFQRRLEALGQRPRQLPGGVESPAPQAGRRRRYRDDRATEHVGGGKPLDPFRHQISDRQQVTELQRRDEVASNPLIRRRRPSSVQSRRPVAQERLSVRESPPTAITDDRFHPTGSPASRTQRGHQSVGNGIRDLHAATLPGPAARMARKKQIFTRNSATNSWRGLPELKSEKRIRFRAQRGVSKSDAAIPRLRLPRLPDRFGRRGSILPRRECSAKCNLVLARPKAALADCS
jgi:hypothetical protein